MGLLQQDAGDGACGREKIINVKNIATEITEDTEDYGRKIFIFSVSSVAKKVLK
jgi:hypothetical protein